MVRSFAPPGMEWDASGLPEAPSAPETLQEAGLSIAFLNDLILRTLYLRGGMLGLDLARQMCLPFKVIEDGLRFLKDEKCLEVAGGDLIGRVSYRFNLTELGRKRAQEAMKLCAYVGPAPVPLEDYIEQTYRQTITGISCNPDVLRASFGHLVLKEDLFNAIGPAIVSGRSIFVYGPPGNGKTSIARAIGDFMNGAGGEVYVPYAFLAENGIVIVYDQAVHQAAEGDALDRVEDNEATIRRLLNTATVDPRWVRIRRPVITTGGELNLSMLDLRYNSEANYYQAPLHVKANGGVFLIDDFGRQLVSPKEILNRWILPLEERHDFLTLANGKKFEVPFEQLIIFSTNLDPKDLVDDAFLRRIRHKVEVNAPTRDVYERIFNNMAKRLGMNSSPESVDYLYDRYYNEGRSPRASDCRDLLEIVQAICRFRRQPVQLTPELIAEASASFIAEFAEERSYQLSSGTEGIPFDHRIGDTMDCRRSLLWVLALASGALGCAMETSTTLPTAPVPAEKIVKADNLPKRDPKPETCVGLADIHEKEAAEPGCSAEDRAEHHRCARLGYQQALRLEPGYVPAYVGLARLNQTLGQPKQAVDMYHKALAKNDKAADIWFELGMCHAKEKQWPEAITSLETAVKNAPENRQYTNMLGFCLVRAGRYDESLPYFEKTMGLAMAHYNIARMLHHMQQEELCRQHLQLALQAKPDLAPAEALLAELEGRAPAPDVVPTGDSEPAVNP